MEILWLDGGQVRPQNGQDIRLGELAARARAVQPWLLFADRTVGGPYENYITPEQTVPEEPLHVPWESCITIGTSFSYRYDDTYKSPRQLVHLLVDIVCKGGNLALNLGGMPDGRLPEPGMRAALGMGEWLKQMARRFMARAFGAPYRQERFGFTRRGGERYAIYCLPEANACRKPCSCPCARPVCVWWRTAVPWLVRRRMGARAYFCPHMWREARRSRWRYAWGREILNECHAAVMAAREQLCDLTPLLTDCGALCGAAAATAMRTGRAAISVSWRRDAVRWRTLG